MENRNLEFSHSVLMEIINNIYQASTDGIWQPVLEKIKNATLSNKAFFFLSNLSEQSPLILEVNTSIKSAESILAYQDNPYDDPYYVMTQQMTQGDTLYLNNYFNILDHKSTDYFNNVLLPLDAGKVIGSCLCRDGEYESFFAINRGFNDPWYCDNTIEFMTTLTPHLSRAISIFKELRYLRQFSSITNSIISQTKHSVLVCDKDGEIILLNDAAKTQLQASSLITIKRNKIYITTPVYQDMLIEHIQHCAKLSHKNLGTQQSITIELDNRFKATINVSSINCHMDDLVIEEESVLINIYFPMPLSISMLISEYGVTDTEAGILLALYENKSLRSVAEERKKSYNTLRNQMQSIYRKMGVKSQVELMVKLTNFTE